MELNFWTRFIAFLLPKSRAFWITVNKPLRQLFEGVAIVAKTIHDHLTDIFLDIWPTSTTKLLQWSQQMGFAQEQTITTIEAAWADGGGQSPSSLQERLQAAGFDVYVHEWWEVPAASPPVKRNPITLINAGNEVLVNDVTVASPKYVNQFQSVAAGNTQFQGDNDVRFGDINGLLYLQKNYATPSITDEYVHYWYVGDSTFPDKADVADTKYDELKRLIYKYKPTHTRVVTLVNLVPEVWQNTVGGSPVYQNTVGGSPVVQNVVA